MDTIIFNSNADIDAYTSSNDYTQDGKNLCFGVVMNKNNIDDKYEYSLRFNLSQYRNKDLPDTNAERIQPISM